MDIVLEQAWSGVVLTASDIGASTGLTRATVVRACGELVERGWLRQIDDLEPGARRGTGRPAGRYALRRDAGVVIGVDRGTRRVVVRVSDLTGATLSEVAVDHADRSGDGAADARVIDAVERALGGAEVSPRCVLAITVGVPVSDRRPDLSSPLSHNGDDGAKGSLRDFFEARSWPVRIETEADLAALASADLLGVHPRDFVTLLCREYLSAGVVSGGRAIRGAHGRIGCLKILSGIDGVGSSEGIESLTRRWSADFGEHGVTPDSLAAAAQEDVVATVILDRLGARFGVILAVLDGAWDTESIVLAGASRAVLSAIRSRLPLAQGDLVAPVSARVTISPLEDSVVVTGAIRSALNVVRRNPPEYPPP